MPQLPSQHNKALEQQPPLPGKAFSIASTSSGSTVSYTKTAPMTPGYPLEQSSTTHSSSYMSSRHPSSPTSTPTSPVERNFLGVITQKMRGRSRSRSRSGVSRDRSKSPLPPQQISPTDTEPLTPRPPQSRHFSGSSHNSTQHQPTSKQAKRQSTDSSHASNPWYGRHSNSWLFNDFSVTEHVSDAYHKLKRRDT